jgi:hypothetical protein
LWFEDKLSCRQFARSYLKKIINKRAGGVAQGVGPEFKPQYSKKKKEAINIFTFSIKY